ncbi:MAG: chaperone modulator CbpM [Arenicellales bacterium]|jgi:chaperone modulatory protein CbpM
MVDPTQVLNGFLLDETVTLTLTEISYACQVHEERIIELVEEGIIEPEFQQRAWHFPATQLRRAHKAIRLQQDLDINLAGVALVLDLLEEIDQLRARLGVS